MEFMRCKGGGTSQSGAAGSSGLQVFDISNPVSPRRVGGTNTSGVARGIALSGNYAYLADGLALEVMDISAPANPVPTTMTSNLRLLAGLTSF